MLWPRLLIGMIVLISTEVFSGASLKTGLWHPWTLGVTYWLYFAHFFFFTTLALWTGRTSFWSLYLWGVLFGLYESWITKVIWHGYGGDGQFVLGHLGPYGYSELSMVVLFHPIMAFILPLAVVCLLCPPLRRWFPDLAWFTSATRGARAFRIYFVIAFGCIVAMNSGGPVNLMCNLAFAGVVLWVLQWLSRPALEKADDRPLVQFGRWGFAGLCVYLGALYTVTYFKLRPDGLPSVPVQLATFLFYALALTGLWLQRRRTTADPGRALVEPGEIRRVVITVLSTLGLGLLLSFFAGQKALFIPVILSFVIWTPLGALLTLAAVARGLFRKQPPP